MGQWKPEDGLDGPGLRYLNEVADEEAGKALEKDEEQLFQKWLAQMEQNDQAARLKVCWYSVQIH